MRILYGWLIASTTIMLAMFGALLLYLCCQALNVAFDYGTFVALVWNFAAVGIIAVFWRAPPLVNRGYLIAVSALMAVFFTFLPEWTTWSILAAISIYDLVAVLCPFGPLRMLVEAAQQRQERIPALLYNGFALLTMADGDGGGDEEEEEGGVKLGLGDFVFYSVLLGRAALFDIITVFTCFIAILTGLFGTLVLLAIFQKVGFSYFVFSFHIFSFFTGPSCFALFYRPCHDVFLPDKIFSHAVCASVWSKQHFHLESGVQSPKINKHFLNSLTFTLLCSNRSNLQ